MREITLMNPQDSPMQTPKPSRRKARRYAVQALYGWAMSQNAAQDIEEHFLIEHQHDNFDRDYFRILLQSVIKQVDSLHELLAPQLDRDLNDLDLVEHTVLRIAVLELRDHLDIPYRVVLNEALDLTKTFGTTDGYKFVNGVLDKLARQLRKTEIKTK